MKKTIICFGDSNTHGYDASSGGRFDTESRWPCILGNLLGQDYAVREEGLSGRTAVFDDPLYEGLSGLSYIYPCLMTHEPVDLLIIMLGTNDVKARFSASPENIAKGLSRLVQKAISSSEAWRTKPNILIIAPPPIGSAYKDTSIFPEMGESCDEKSLKLAGLYRDLAKALNCSFLDAGSIPGVKMGEYDHMHLNLESHRLLASAVASLIPDIV